MVATAVLSFKAMCTMCVSMSCCDAFAASLLDLLKSKNSHASRDHVHMYYKLRSCPIHMLNQVITLHSAYGCSYSLLSSISHGP